MKFQSLRLIMKPVHRDLASQVWPILQDENLYTFIPQDPPSLEALEKRYLFLENTLSPDKTEYWLNWVLFNQDKQEVIGTLQAGVHIENKQATIAYMIGIHAQNKGYATEAVQALIHYLKDQYQITQVKAWIDTRNAASIRLVEKVGMQQVEFIEKADHFKGSDSDEYVYQLDIV